MVSTGRLAARKAVACYSGWQQDLVALQTCPCPWLLASCPVGAHAYRPACKGKLSHDFMHMWQSQPLWCLLASPRQVHPALACMQVWQSLLLRCPGSPVGVPQLASCQRPPPPWPLLGTAPARRSPSAPTSSRPGNGTMTPLAAGCSAQPLPRAACRCHCSSRCRGAAAVRSNVGHCPRGPREQGRPLGSQPRQRLGSPCSLRARGASHGPVRLVGRP